MTTLHDYGPTCRLHSNNPNAGAFLQIFSRLHSIPITSWFPAPVILPGFDVPQPAFMLDLARLTPHERRQLTQHIAAVLHLATDDAAAHLETSGVPLLAKSVVVQMPLPILD